MNFSLTTVLWLFALLAAGMGTFGAAGGLAACALVLMAWALYSRQSALRWLLALLGCSLIAALLLPAMANATGAARRNQCTNQMKMISLALLLYQDTHGHYPPAYTVDDDGRPLHSWRVLILPYIEEERLYRQIKLDEPWDSVHNRQFADQMPRMFACPECEACRGQRGNPWRLPGEDCTNYFVVVDQAAAFAPGVGRPIRDFIDGTSNCVLVVEATDREVNWMAPQDLTMDEAVHLLTDPAAPRHATRHDALFVTTFQLGGGNLAFADGHVQFEYPFANAEIARSILTIDGEEEIDLLDVSTPNAARPDALVVMRWGHVFSFVLFVALAFAPGFRKKPQP